VWVRVFFSSMLCLFFQMEAAPVASALPSKDASTALELDDAGVKPKVPDPSTVFRVDAGGVKIKVEAGVEVEPKPEPCDEDAPAAWDDDDDDCEITPVSGARPFFTTVMSRSQVQKPFQLVRYATRTQHHSFFLSFSEVKKKGTIFVAR
jgi:hypothetical protein